MAPAASFAQFQSSSPAQSYLQQQPYGQQQPSQDPRALSRQLEPYRVVPSFALLETATDNVDLRPNDQRQSDLVSIITPGLLISGRGEHTSLNGGISIPVALYVRTGAENNKVYPRVNLVGDVALFDKFLHIEGAVSVEEQFFTPFGAQPSSLANATDNRYRTQTYRVSPYIKGLTPGGVSYELRNNNIWSDLGGAPTATNDSRYNQLFGVASDTQARVGWRANFDVSRTVFNEQNPITLRLIRAEPIYNATQQLRLSASIGYEDNEYTFTESRDTIYGGGLEWRPSDRTFAVAKYEHRFFGASYLASLDHRTPLSTWSVRISRNITTYPQQIGALAPGVSVDAMLNALFRSQFPDSVERQQFVDQFIQDRALPPVLASPVVLYGERITLQQAQTVSMGLIGARNTIVFTIFNVLSETIAGSGSALPPILAASENNTQTGGSIVWTHNLSPALQLTASVQGSRTSANAPASGTTNQGAANLVLSTSLSPHTRIFGGGRYQALSSDVTNDYHEAAVFVGVNYLFR